MILSACDSACQSQYSGRCTSSGSDDCCPVFDGGVCADSCAVNFAPDMDDCYQCGKKTIMMICKLINSIINSVTYEVAIISLLNPT